MRIILLKAEQLGLFDMPVRVSGSVDKHGHIRAPHTRVQKKRLKPAANPKADASEDQSLARQVGRPLAGFIRRHGGVARLGHLLGTMTEGQQQKLLDSMASLSGRSKDEVVALFEGAKREDPAPTETVDLFSHPHSEAPAQEPEEPKGPKPEPADVSKKPKNVNTSAQNAYGIDYSSPFESIAIPSFGVPAGTSKAERRRLNAAAVDLLDKAQHTDGERAILAQYSGNGGVGDSLNEYYTLPAVAAAVWKSLRGLGVEGGQVLEPSCATGVFLATAPSGTRVTGVELDPTSARIATALHGAQHEIRNSSLERFATTDERQFDAVIGNAPFGLRGEHLRDDKPDLKTAEAYFLDTALDKTKPGGVTAMIVPTGVMDGKNNRSLRERLLRKAEFLGAQRMPNTAFEHSHTGVTTDVVYLRKRPDDVAGALSAVDQDTLKSLGVWDDEFLAGSYFTGLGVGNVFGSTEQGWRAKAGIGDDITVSGSMQGVPESIAEFSAPEPGEPLTVAAILDSIDDEEVRARAVGAAERQPYQAAKVGDTKEIDGVTYVLQGDPPRWHRVDEVLDAGMVSTAGELAQEIDRLMAGETADRPQLEKDIRAFIDQHGIPARNKDLLLAAQADKRIHRLIGAVGLDGRLSDVVTGKVTRRESSLDATAQALALEHESRDFEAGELAGRLGREVEEVEDHLVADASYAYTDGDRWAPMDTYLTGDLWPKLDFVREALASGDLDPDLTEKFATQERLLLEAIDPRSLEDVEIQLNSAFIPPDIIAAWLNWRNHEAEDANKYTKDLPPVAIEFSDGVYTITGGNEYGDQALLHKYLNRTGVRKDDRPRLDVLNEQFKDWLCGSRYRDEIEDLYNRKFRGFKPEEFSDAPIDIPGLANHGDIKNYQWPGLRWAMAAGKGIIAADVGLGKTLRGLLLARMAQIQGNAKKPIIVVPKSVLANWAAEAEKWFPDSKVMVLGATFSRDDNGELKGKDDNKAERARKLHDLTQNDYDFVICSETVYQEVDLNPELKKQYSDQDFWVQRGDSLGNAGDKRARKIRESYNQHVADRDRKKRTDAIYFDDLGVDMIIRDEGHREKNLWAARNRFGETPKFLGGQGESQRAYDFYLKSKYIRDRNDGRNVYMLTATPTKNSPLEVYSMLSHIAPEAFENIGIRNSEEFLDRFCVFENDHIYTLAGQFEDALVTSGFKNLDELREIMSQYVDRKTAEDVGLELPERDDRMHYLEMDAVQRAAYLDLRKRLEESKDTDDATGDAHIFAIMSDMAKAALDPELYDPKTYAGLKSPKYEAVAKNAAEMAKDGGGQVIFAQYIDAHNKIVDALVAHGANRDEIAVVNSKVAGSAAKRQKISDQFNAGKLKYVVGNSTMEEGMNLQRLTSDIHHLDLPWEPASLQQRNGRGLRQGNTNEAVRIHTYISKGTFDGYRYQSMTRKKDWQDLLWHGGDRVDNLLKEGQVSHDDLAIMCADDPEAAAKALAENKALAAQRYDAERYAAAAQEFDRYRQLRTNYAKLSNKESTSARRLKVRVDRAREQLRANKHFKAKAALDSTAPVLIHPATGDAVAAGQGYDLPYKKEINRVVVTEVDPTKKMVTVREYGVPGARNARVSLDEFGRAKPFAYDEDEETGIIDRKLSEQAEANVETVVHPASLRGMPPTVMDKHYNTIQGKLKGALRNYQWKHPDHYSSGPVGFVDGDGNATWTESYSAREAADKHDVLLPTAEHREKALAAWTAAERGKRFMNDYVTQRRGGRTTPILKQKYADASGSYYGSHTSNPWSSVGKDVFGDGFEAEARQRFHREQFEAARRADSFPAAMQALAPTIDHDYSGTKWPKRTLAILWAKAKRAGVLDSPMKEVAVAPNEHGREAPIIPAAMMRTGDIGGDPTTVHGVLARLAAHNNHGDLAAAVHSSRATDRESAAESIRSLIRMKGGDKWDAIRHLADKFNLGYKTPADLDISQYNVGFGRYQVPLIDILDEESPQRSAA